MAAALRAPHKHHHGSAALKIQGGEAQSGQHDLNNGAWSLAERLPLGVGWGMGPMVVPPGRGFVPVKIQSVPI